MNIDSTIIDAVDNKNGTISVLVDAKHAQSFYSFLKERKIPCGPLSDAIYQGTRIYQDKNGEWRREQQCTVQTLDLTCNWNDFTKTVDEWCLAVFYRKPISN